MLSSAYYHSSELPWSPSLTEERRFRVITAWMLATYVVLAAAALLIKVAPMDRAAVESVPPRLAKLVIEEKPKPTPAPPEVKHAKPEERKAEETKPAAKPETPEPKVTAARRKASHTGLVALSDELASLQRNDLGALVQDRPLTNADDRTMVHRSIITSQATRGSGGIGAAQLSRDPGETHLASRSTTLVKSEALDGEKATAGGDQRNGRSSEEIQMILDRNKGALYTLYHRALRVNPALQGKVVLEITIAPGGEITGCRVISAEVADADLVR